MVDPLEYLIPSSAENIFTESGKVAIGRFKLEALREMAKLSLSDEESFARFMNGEEFAVEEFDIQGLREHLVYPDRNVEAYMLTELVLNGVRDGIRAIRPVRSYEIKATSMIDYDEDLGTAKITWVRRFASDLESRSN